MKTYFIALAAVAMMASGCATTPTTTAEAGTPASSEQKKAPETQTTQVDENDVDRIVCKRVTRVGSRFTENVCRPWSEWRDLEKDSQSEIFRSRRATGSNPAG